MEGCGGGGDAVVENVREDFGGERGEGCFGQGDGGGGGGGDGCVCEWLVSEYPCQCRTLSTPHARHASCLVTLPLSLPTNHLSSHRLYLPIAVMSSQLDVTLAHACDALRIGQYPSFRAMVKAYSLTKSTL